MDTYFKDMRAGIWYCDNIPIYGRHTQVEQQAIVKEVLQQCIKHRLAVNLIKSKFHIAKTIVLVHGING